MNQRTNTRTRVVEVSSSYILCNYLCHYTSTAFGNLPSTNIYYDEIYNLPTNLTLNIRIRMYVRVCMDEQARTYVCLQYDTNSYLLQYTTKQTKTLRQQQYKILFALIFRMLVSQQRVQLQQKQQQNIRKTMHNTVCSEQFQCEDIQHPVKLLSNLTHTSFHFSYNCMAFL